MVTLKRPMEEVDEDLLSLAEEQKNASQELKKKKRRHNLAAMTQFSADGTATTDEEVDEIRSGYIKKVSLRNFMCHENFELELGPKLNFIVGSNGSGKSAILTAITIALGAKASDTNRGNSLKELIKEGCYSAKITLVIENGKQGAYDQGTYGKEIIIERTLRRDGSPSFSLKSESGVEISNKKRDIQTVVDFFSVPVNNPMCFLSQDAARSFLTASTPQDKYNHFGKGTLLQQIREHLTHAKEISDTSSENMDLHLQNLAILQNEYLEAKKLLKELNETSDLNEQKRLLQGKSLWIDIEHNNQSCQELRQNIKTFQTKIAEVMAKIESKKEKIERYTADGASIEKEIDEKVVTVSQKDQEHQATRDSLREVRKVFETEKSNQREAEQNITQCRNRIKTLDKTIEHLEQDLKKEMGGDKEQMREEQISLEHESDQLRKELSDLQISMDEMKNEERDIIRQRQTELQGIERSICLLYTSRCV